MIKLFIEISEKEDRPGRTHFEIICPDIDRANRAELERVAELFTILSMFATEGKDKPDFLNNEQWDLLKQGARYRAEEIVSMIERRKRLN